MDWPLPLGDSYGPRIVDATDRIRGSCDVAVVGGGAAGMHVALEAVEEGATVFLISRKQLSESASFWAQGGLAAAMAPDDSPARHAEDTLNAGRGLCRPEVVQHLVEGAPAAVETLQRRGVSFDADAGGALELGLEGGHSARRIVHAGGAQTGRAITSKLAELVSRHPRIEVLEGASATSLWSDGEHCYGVGTDEGALLASATVLTTGGGAALWSRTTNPFGAVAAGSVLAHGAGAELADLELCQFHPTALAVDGSKLDGRLITEAMRGEGARLRDITGKRFTDELAPRDQVTAAILARMDADGTDHVGLDLSPVDLSRYPAIAELLRGAGFDPEREPIPVSPASHYLIGGIRADDEGRTSLAGLYAVGECSTTGLHGANRLASNSLSECFVFGTRAATAACEEPPPPARPPASVGVEFIPPTPRTRVRMWELAGPRRRAGQLEQLLEDPYPLAPLIAASALARQESRGTHRRSDHPRSSPLLDRRHTVVDASGEVRVETW